MYVVLGATGHVGSSVVAALGSSGEHVTAIAHDPEKAKTIQGNNVEVVIADVANEDRLHAVFRQAKRAFLLNPPASRASDTNSEELKTARSIARAVGGSDLEKVVVASSYGAQAGDGIGDLSVLYEFEQLVQGTGVPTAINRAAYYFTNLDNLLETAKEGHLSSPFPGDLVLPMVSPADLAEVAAIRLSSTNNDVGIKYVEGPRRYTFTEVAQAFSNALGLPVALQGIARQRIEKSFREQGFSEAAARSYARMTMATIDGAELPNEPIRGKVTLEEHVNSLVSQT
ncbi:NmrA family transcriptional regulator [Ensifer sp. NM-2]|uniref:NmrA family NAD(P)-binding protein n=1 Tax=unclassified Ensifer TaxID=2633371 RepID=UPI00070CE6A3|nr:MULTISPECIES: NmrA family NAD(P)-binding protein [unclassified Ensifer]KQU96063.1 NmrA family transcriptional regulator [Ensifer sp. Root31]PSS64344.1 NmrA family transcriptional regulator [Ensifer sp. NM-2]